MSAAKPRKHNWVDPEKERLANLAGIRAGYILDSDDAEALKQALGAREPGKLELLPALPDPERYIRHAICLLLISMANWFRVKASRL